jgi:hypothetical protein
LDFAASSYAYDTATYSELLMALNDVWRNINKEIGIYWKGRFEQVPDVPGVYAWFYPLRITTPELVVFLDDIGKLFSFDARRNGLADRSALLRFAWEEAGIDLRLRPTNAALPADLTSVWNHVLANQERFDRLRMVVMRGSLLMPPLYVGKTKSLSVRCQQHLAGTGNNDFHGRFQQYAAKVELAARTVEDLLFTCIQTGESGDNADEAIEGLVEEILKRACRPKYSAR